MTECDDNRIRALESAARQALDELKNPIGGAAKRAVISVLESALGREDTEK